MLMMSCKVGRDNFKHAWRDLISQKLHDTFRVDLRIKVCYVRNHCEQKDHGRKNGEDKVECYTICSIQDLIIHQIGKEDL